MKVATISWYHFGITRLVTHLCRHEDFLNMHLPINCPVLYLDFDGVLHPDEVYRIRGKIVLKWDGIALFEWAQLLAQDLEHFPEVRIILSTSWVHVLSFNYARSQLPEAVAKRVIGATWHSTMNLSWWFSLTRFEQIKFHAQRHKISRWLAIDDNGYGWPAEESGRLVHTDSMLGIAAPDSRQLLQKKLREM